ncbi:hypothetical protein [Celeribacter marinus]
MTKSNEHPRWMQSIIEEAQKKGVTLPWHRDLRAIKRAAESQGTPRAANA